VGFAGDMSRVQRGRINQWNINLLLKGDDRTVFEQFRDDIEAGRFAFWLNWNPDLFPDRWKFYLTDRDEWRVQYEAGGEAITWNMRVREIGKPFAKQ